MPKSNYVVVNAEKSFCPDCKKSVTLLCAKRFQSRKPQFYICFPCKKIFQVGKDVVENEEQVGVS